MRPVERLTAMLEQHRNEERALPMRKYMKDHFPFLGIPTPERRQIVTAFFGESGMLVHSFQPDFVWACWEKEEREYQYAALDYIGKMKKKLAKRDLPFLETLIVTKSWWDTVDALAPHPVGWIARQYPEVVHETIDGWAESDQLWLRRSAILFQLAFKERTDEALLYRYIRQNADSKQFFIRKAMGWALREYAKTNPESVKRFVQAHEHELPTLTVREAIRRL